LQGHELKQNVFSSAFFGSDTVSFQLYSSILDDESELESMEIGMQAVFSVKKYRNKMIEGMALDALIWRKF
jgi:hypothetical protein